MNDLGHGMPGAEVSSVLTGIATQPKQTDGHAGSGPAVNSTNTGTNSQCAARETSFPKELGKKSDLSSPGNCQREHFRILVCEVSKM